MENDNKLTLDQYKEIGEYWDENSLADHWEQTEEAAFNISPNARSRYSIAIDPPLLGKVQDLAKSRDLSIEVLVNLFLKQHLQTLEAQA